MDMNSRESNEGRMRLERGGEEEGRHDEYREGGASNNDHDTMSANSTAGTNGRALQSGNQNSDEHGSNNDNDNDNDNDGNGFGMSVPVAMETDDDNRITMNEYFLMRAPNEESSDYEDEEEGGEENDERGEGESVETQDIQETPPDPDPDPSLIPSLEPSTELPLARHHTYLPGVSHPLFPEQWLGLGTHDTNNPPYHNPTVDSSDAIHPAISSHHQKKRRRERRIRRDVQHFTADTYQNQNSQLDYNYDCQYTAAPSHASSSSEYSSSSSSSEEEPAPTIPSSPSSSSPDQHFTHSSPLLSTVSSHISQTNSKPPRSYPSLHTSKNETTFANRPSNLSHSINNRIELAILELDDVFLFPGSTLPLRLRNYEWVSYLGQKINDARDLLLNNSSTSNNTTAQVRIGVVTRMKTTRRRRPQYSQRQRSRNHHSTNYQTREMGRWNVEFLRRGIFNRRTRTSNRTTRNTNSQSNAGGAYENVENDDADGAEGGRINRNDNDNDDRSSIQENEDDDNSDRGGDGDSGSDSDSDDHELEERLRFLHPTQPPSIPVDSLVGRIGTFATITYTHEEQQSEDAASLLGDHQSGSRYQHQQRSLTSTSASRVWTRHGGQLVITALGTGRFQILSRISNQDFDDNGNGHRSSRDMDRCKLYEVEDLNDSNVPLPFPSSMMKKNRPHFMEHGIPNFNDSSDNKDYEADDGVNEQFDGIEQQQKKKQQQEQAPSKVYLDYHNRLVSDLSKLSPIPSFAFRLAWPWRLVEQISSEICSNPTFRGLQKSLPLSSGRRWQQRELYGQRKERSKSLRGSDGVNIGQGHESYEDNDFASEQVNDYFIDPSMINPMAFSFWMAANMPLSEHDRLELLEMHCTIQRLQFILDKLVNQKQLARHIRCKRCGLDMAKVSDFFTVGGAEGTTGAYVNEHGIVHQTITIRSVINGSVVCYGGAETRDSWFPGYSWTVAYCALCQAHLGWKFQMVSRHNLSSGHVRRSTPTKDRPDMFWGLSGANITTDFKASPIRIFSQMDDDDED